MIRKVLSCASLIFIFIPIFVFAQSCGQPGLPPCSPLGVVESGSNPGVDYYDPISGTTKTFDPNTVDDTILNLVDWFAWFVAVVSVVMGLYAGMLFMTARGDPGQLGTARKTLMWAVVGVGVAIVSFSIIVVAKTILGL